MHSCSSVASSITLLLLLLRATAVALGEIGDMVEGGLAAMEMVAMARV
jgi:hypothetical protein